MAGETAYETKLIAEALSHRADSLERLAKKTKEEGYVREARNIAGDAVVIRETLLPRTREQQDLPLAGPEEARAGIANYLRGHLEKGRMFKDDDAALMNRLANAVTRLVEAVADRAYIAGVAERHREPEVLTLRALEALDSTGADE